MTDNQTNQRKLDHIQIVLDQKAETYWHVFDAYDLPYQALPEQDLREVITSCEFFGKKLSFPFLIGSMTGGPEKGLMINKNLAIAAEHCKVALALGSMRVCKEDSESYKTFDVRKYCPSIPLFANVWMVQLNYGFTAHEINELVDTIQADGIFLHINALQEAIQPEGDVNFNGLLSKLSQIIKDIHKPILIKECGNGIDRRTASKLVEMGIQWMDVSWKWGTSRPAVEWQRRKDHLADPIIQLWIATDKAILQCKDIPWISMIAWGGLRHGIDVLKALYLWATIGTAAAPFLAPALESAEEVAKVLEMRKRQYQIGKWSMGNAWLTLGE